ncbi:uncharacterized protein LOC103721508 isoform X2 [Phoenix dactylifera]|uniref:Uncharacterized protein LOC103721508 isoform X2 n=1 Tax=Phoenix dactylifera TaxID=42345 RepID=A0A8B7MX18_PHODC|nr:uncharacterized protein LOC103721508 isoform X2 [Phoenix dactylifera]
MGKRLPLATSLVEFARIATERIRRAKHSKPGLRSLASKEEASAAAAAAAAAAARASAEDRRPVGRVMEDGERQERRVPLSEVVSDCVRRWFQDALNEARTGDPGMQVLVGQMYHSGYGCPRNEQKGKAWIAKASRYRSAAWKVSYKHPGYNASDSDSDEAKDDVK